MTAFEKITIMLRCCGSLQAGALVLYTVPAFAPEDPCSHCKAKPVPARKSSLHGCRATKANKAPVYRISWVVLPRSWSLALARVQASRSSLPCNSGPNASRLVKQQMRQHAIDTISEISFKT